MNNKQRDAFHKKMKSQGWKPKRDLFKIIYQWEHKQTGKIITDKICGNHFTSTGSAPIPF